MTSVIAEGPVVLRCLRCGGAFIVREGHAFERDLFDPAGHALPADPCPHCGGRGETERLGSEMAFWPAEEPKDGPGKKR